MPKIIARLKPGRPSRSLVDVLRTQLWFHVLKLRSGLPSSYSIEKTLEPHLVRVADDRIIRPRKWDAYERGSRVPSRKRDASDAIELAEQNFPGTAQWFDSPIWDVLKGATPDQRTLQNQLRILSPQVVDILVDRDTSMSNGRPELVDLTPNHFDRLAALGSFDALTAIVLLVKLSDEIASPELRDMCLTCYACLQPMLADTPEVCVHYPDLFTYVDNICQHWIMLSPGRRMKVHLFWHSQEWAKERQQHIQERLKILYRAENWGQGWEAQQ